MGRARGVKEVGGKEEGGDGKEDGRGRVRWEGQIKGGEADEREGQRERGK